MKLNQIDTNEINEDHAAENTTFQPAEVADNDGPLQTGGDSPPLDEVDSTGGGNEGAESDSDHVDMITDMDTKVDVEADPEVDIEIEDDAEAQTESQADDEDPETGTDTADAGNGDTTKTPLPDGVTATPRNPEELHLDLIREWPNAVKVYLKVSDDAGEVLGNKVLERQVTQFNSLYAHPKTEIKDPKKVLESAKDLATRYALQINMVESGLVGIIAKHRIRQGEIFLIMQDMVKKIKGINWTEWFKSNFDPREFRSVQDYMRLAKIPGIIRYAVFGKERLLQIIRQLSKDERNGSDPIGTFIEEKGINFNPTQEVDAQELRIEADIAINHQKLVDAGITEITEEMVGVLVRNGREVETTHVRELKATKELRDDVIEKFQEILASKGKLEPVMTPTRKAEGFKKTTDRFLKAMESAIEDAEYRGQVNAETIASLRDKIQQLERLVQPTA